jgi:hypothetical protein
MTRIACQACGGEGREYKSRYGGNDPDVWDAGPCNACDGTGYEESDDDALVVSMAREQAHRIMRLPTCPNCGLKAASLEHRFCTHQDCPVLAAIATLKQRTAENAD